ncbi:MAG: MBL fold metallo-hydrolase [Citrobacter freundii]|nr:MAG: MBL fold metallo-hydrolase [Citrobacter freundii]
MKLYSINTGYFKLDGGAMFGVVPKSIWNKLNPADDNNMCSWALRSLLIETDGRLILVDTGMGDKQDAKFFGHYYLHGDDTLDKSLAKYGFHRDDITDVFLTHLHFDHCGGAIKKIEDKYVPAFKNATFWSNKYHWDWATNPNDREKASFLKENILPINESGRLQFFNPSDADFETWDELSGVISKEFAPGISIRFASGHTRGMMLPQIQYKGRTVVFMADLLPSAAHIPMPYVMSYDTTPLTTLEEKRAFYRDAIRENYVLFFEHDPVNECCTLQQTEKGVRAGEFFTLDSL